MLIFGFLLVPMVLSASTKLSRSTYIPKIKDGEFTSIEVIGEPSDTLDLSGSDIENIDANVFENLTHVKSINLANNFINEYHLPQSTFSRLGELENLSLADNYINSLGSGRFMGLSNLKFLNISNNPIGPLSRGTFYGLGKSTNISAKIEGGLTILHTLVFDHFNESRSQGHEGSTKSPPMFHPFSDDWGARPNRVRLNALVYVRDGILEKIELYSYSLSPLWGTSKGPRPMHLQLRQYPFALLKIKPSFVYPANIIYDDHWKFVYSFRDMDDSGYYLELNNLEISKFAAGWHSNNVSLFKGLNFDNNNITDITAEFLNDLPANITNINLSNNKIVRLTKQIIVNEHIRSLNLSENFISEIDDGALEKTKLSSVDLRKNQLNNTRFVTTLPPTLQSLILSENYINELLPDVFSRFHELDKIDFAGNNITVIKYESLRGLNSVKSLNLARNKIEKIEMGAFQNLTSLRFLDLSNNNLNYLKKGVFDGLQVLDHMDLSSNNIKEITRDFFYNLPNTLRTLSLSFNQFSILKNGTFFKVPIQKLYLNDNKIREIENGTFASTTLKALDLGHNLLGQIDGDEFTGLDNLERLNLSRNNISEIKKGFAKHLGKLIELDLGYNPIERLENGALFGITKAENSIVRLNGIQLDLLQGGVFDDL